MLLIRSFPQKEPLVTNRNTEDQAHQELLTFRLQFLIVLLTIAVAWQVSDNVTIRHYVRMFTAHPQMLAHPTSSQI
jgi:hypothetical protein